MRRKNSSAAPESIFRAESDHFVADGAIMLAYVIERHRQPEIDRAQRADLVRQVEFGDAEIVLRLHELDAIVEQLLLLVQHVEDGPGADLCLLPDAFER